MPRSSLELGGKGGRTSISQASVERMELRPCRARAFSASTAEVAASKTEALVAYFGFALLLGHVSTALVLRDE